VEKGGEKVGCVGWRGEEKVEVEVEKGGEWRRVVIQMVATKIGSDDTDGSGGG
jgi:hypothetical protein